MRSRCREQADQESTDPLFHLVKLLRLKPAVGRSCSGRTAILGKARTGANSRRPAAQDNILKGRFPCEAARDKPLEIAPSPTVLSHLVPGRFVCTRAKCIPS